MTSPLRTAEYNTLKTITLTGEVLDLGGVGGSVYGKNFQGAYTLTVVNNDKDAHPDVVHNLEQPLPFEDASYNGVLLINVLEHIYDFNQLLDESHRVLKKDGMLVVVVPFLFPVHPSPKDFWRFTDETLKRVLQERGFANITVRTLGGGVCLAQALLTQRLLPKPIRVIYDAVCVPSARLCDRFVMYIADMLGKKYKPTDYALGYLVTAER